MKKKKTYAIFGLGRFGMTLARELAAQGEEVIAIDKDINLINEADEFAVAYSFDFTSMDALKASGIKDIDVAVVATGENLEEAILLILNLKELNIPRIIAKAQNQKFGLALEKVGADQIVLPERDMAKRLALRLSSSDDLLEMFNLGTGAIAYEMKVKSSWVGKSLIDLDLRGKYAVNVVGVKTSEGVKVNVNPNRQFEEDDTLLIISDEKSFKEIEKVK